jgi:hypothetical protein
VLSTPLLTVKVNGAGGAGLTAGTRLIGETVQLGGAPEPQLKLTGLV